MSNKSRSLAWSLIPFDALKRPAEPAQPAGSPKQSSAGSALYRGEAKAGGSGSQPASESKAPLSAPRDAAESAQARHHRYAASHLTSGPGPQRSVTLAPFHRSGPKAVTPDNQAALEGSYGFSIRQEPKKRRVILELRYPQGTHEVAITWTREVGRPRPQWLQAIGNTFMRLPLSHSREVGKIVFNNVPTLNGRVLKLTKTSSMIELHEQLFTGPNGWMRASHGDVWMYRSSHPERTLNQLPPDHNEFSPVLIHEIGHAIGHRLRERMGGNDVAKDQPRNENYESMATAYGAGHAHNRPTENWAEQYRLFYQSPQTRRGLLNVENSAYHVLLEDERRSGPPPWERGLPSPEGYIASRWNNRRADPIAAAANNDTRLAGDTNGNARGGTPKEGDTRGGAPEARVPQS